jgi:hypothetical protein
MQLIRFIVLVPNDKTPTYFGPFVSERTAHEFADKYPNSVVRKIHTPTPNQSTRPVAA